MNNELTALRKTFAFHYHRTHDIKTSAIACGIDPETASAKGLELLQSKQTQREVRRLERQSEKLIEPIKNGLMRLAFGRSNDIAELVFSQTEASPHKIQRMNLFNACEIKRDKSGGVEIKLFDRLKAFDALIKLIENADGDEAVKAFAAVFSDSGDEVE